MNETSELENTTAKHDTEQNESTTNECEDDSNNATNESDSESITDTDDMNAGTSTLNCNGATNNDLFPTTRLGSLDKTILKKLGIKRKILETNDFLFFYQLILPICNTEKLGFRGDEQLSYYAQVKEWSNLCAYQIGLGGSYVYEFKNVPVKEIFHHDKYVVRDNVRGGNSGDIYRHWQIGADYDNNIILTFCTFSYICYCYLNAFFCL